MANTLIPIQTTTLTATASSVTFSNIPQNYTDLKIVLSARTTDAAEISSLAVSFGSTSYTYSTRILGGDGTNVYSSNSSDAGTAVGVYWLSGGSSTAATFANGEIYLPNYTSSTNKVFQYEILPEFNSATNRPMIGIVTVTKTDAVDRIILSANFAIGTTFTLYGVSNGVKATGGTLTVAGGYAYHTFTSTGSFLPNQQIKGAEVLAVAGGGGGGGYAYTGGGGAGGVLYSPGQTFNAGTSYTALVGAGGAAGPATSGDASNGTNGGNSVLGNAIAIGGGGGAGYSSTQNGLAGGSGGGAGGSATGTGGTATSGQGNTGGNNTLGSGGGAGGGGAGAVGGNRTGQTGANGGVGTTTYSVWHSITGTGILSGTSYYIAAGGGGGGGTSPSGYSAGSGGTGGGGNGNTSGAGSAATSNTGGGGGGGGWTGTPYAGGAGGSGIIIVRYPLS